MKLLNYNIFLLAVIYLIWMPLVIADVAETVVAEDAFKQAMEFYKQNDFAEAKSGYEKAATQEHAEAQYYLGLLYDIGEGVPQDFIKAVSWYRKAAKQGLVQAQRAMGTRHNLI